TGRRTSGNGRQQPPREDGPQPSFYVNKRTIKAINDAAMTNFAAWVPDLFPAGVEGNGSWRISSAALGRDLQEDISITPDGISITPDGIVDFGPHDMGDPRRGRRTPIELVQAWRHQDLGQAAEWLRAKLNINFDGIDIVIDEINESYAFVLAGDKAVVMKVE